MDLEIVPPSYPFLQDAWGRSCGDAPIRFANPKVAPKPVDPLRALYLSEWSPIFEQYMRNRLVMGYFRYGPLYGQKKGIYDSVGGAIKRLQQYQREGNDELLVDAANLCLVEFVKGCHPYKHFRAVDDGEHVKENK